MSGHNKWSKIKGKKGAADAIRGRMFSRLAKELAVAARQGGGDPNVNASLRSIIQRCRTISMSSDNIERGIKKGTGELQSKALEEITYETYAQGSVALVILALTDSKNRAAADIRRTLENKGSTLAAQGSVSRLFKRKGIISVSGLPMIKWDGAEEGFLVDFVMENIANGAEDVTETGESCFEVTTEPGKIHQLAEALTATEKFKVDKAETSLVPSLLVKVSDMQVAKSVISLVDALEELEDVQEVHTNMDLDDEVLKKIEAEEPKE